jgi:hypothetical protein
MAMPGGVPLALVLARNVKYIMPVSISRCDHCCTGGSEGADLMVSTALVGGGQQHPSWGHTSVATVVATVKPSSVQQL